METILTLATMRIPSPNQQEHPSRTNHQRILMFFIQSQRLKLLESLWQHTIQYYRTKNKEIKKDTSKPCIRLVSCNQKNYKYTFNELLTRNLTNRTQSNVCSTDTLPNQTSLHKCMGSYTHTSKVVMTIKYACFKP